MADSETEPGREPEIATGTLAEIYAQQGLYDRALAIYRRIERRRPDDPEVSRRIEALEEAREHREVEETVVPPEESGAPEGPPLEEASGIEPPRRPEGEVAAESPPASEDDAEFLSWLESR